MRSSHQPTALAVAIAAIYAMTPGLGWAADAVLPEVTVNGAPSDGKVFTSDPQPTPKSSIGKAGLTLFGGPAQTSLYAPMNQLPSTIVESPDPYGLSLTRNINIRGKGDFHVTRNVEGLPLSGIVGGADLFDLENVEQLDVYRGGIAANQGLGVSNATGVVNQQLLAPRNRFGVLGKQAVGSYDFRRTFVRLDSGTLASSGTRAFLSASNSASDKWKGGGDTMRNNAMLGISQQLGERVQVDLDMVYNKFKGNTYRSLSYAQLQSLSDNYKYDYNTSLTGNAAADVNYYDFNRAQYENYAALANIDVKLSDSQHLLLKPYYWKDNGISYSASGSTVQIWHQQNDNVGSVLEYQGRYGVGTELIAGYWFQAMQPPPPPTDQMKYTVNANGGLTYAGWATLAKIDRFKFSSPYVQATQNIGQTIVSGGLRYMDLGAPQMRYYKTAGLPDVSYDQIWGYNPTLDANAAVAAKHHRALLPNIGVRQEISSAWSASASYSRKFGRPDWGPQASNYISNEAAFVAKGVTLQSLVDGVKPELSDQFDISVPYRNGGLTVVPTLFLAKNQNRQVMVVDPALGGLSYYRSTAKTTGYGVELEGGLDLGSTWSIFGSGTLASETYDQDTPTLAGGATMGTKGKQIPNAPKLMLKGGFTYRWQDLSVSPLMRYVGYRYGDSTQTQKVGSYSVFDLNAGYGFSKAVRLDLTVANLFDRKYISEISTNDFNLNGATAYYAGAPRTVAATISAQY